jgi:minichromosome maintenance protein 10
MCGATKRDGKVCGSWCDKRVSDCCEYHVEHAVQRKRAGRAEFSIGYVASRSEGKQLGGTDVLQDVRNDYNATRPETRI